jgi:hypothetical protein
MPQRLIGCKIGCGSKQNIVIILVNNMKGRERQGDL